VVVVSGFGGVGPDSSSEVVVEKEDEEGIIGTAESLLVLLLPSCFLLLFVRWLDDDE